MAGGGPAGGARAVAAASVAAAAASVASKEAFKLRFRGVFEPHGSALVIQRCWKLFQLRKVAHAGAPPAAEPAPVAGLATGAAARVAAASVAAAGASLAAKEAFKLRFRGVSEGCGCRRGAAVADRP